MNNQKPALLWITREKLWIKLYIWGETGKSILLLFFSHPYIWGVLMGAPHRSQLLVGWGKQAFFLQCYPGSPWGEKPRFYHPGMGSWSGLPPYPRQPNPAQVFSPHIHTPYYDDYIDTDNNKRLISSLQTQRQVDHPCFRYLRQLKILGNQRISHHGNFAHRDW
jgi:hypothetical protein